MMAFPFAIFSYFLLVFRVIGFSEDLLTGKKTVAEIRDEVLEDFGLRNSR